jgi:hypothetical protein
MEGLVQEEDLQILDITDALDAAERAGTPAQALEILAQWCGVSQWWKPQGSK